LGYNTPLPTRKTASSDNFSLNQPTILTAEEETILARHGALPAKSKYGLAYLILIHDDSNLQTAKDLVNEIDDGNTIIMIHVDARNDKLHANMKKWIEARPLISSDPDLIALKKGDFKEPELPKPRNRDDWIKMFPDDLMDMAMAKKEAAAKTKAEREKWEKEKLEREKKMAAKKDKDDEKKKEKNKEREKGNLKEKREVKAGDEKASPKPLPKPEAVYSNVTSTNKDAPAQPAPATVAAGSSSTNKILRRNIFLTHNRIYGLWAHSTLVTMQMTSFFELSHLAEWDFVINLSASDYPLRSSKETHRWLATDGRNGTGYKGMALVDHYHDGE
jgi:hypothetical protein